MNIKKRIDKLENKAHSMPGTVRIIKEHPSGLLEYKGDFISREDFDKLCNPKDVIIIDDLSIDS